jgi:hypothetical protein
MSCMGEALTHQTVIPGLAKREPGTHKHYPFRT